MSLINFISMSWLHLDLLYWAVAQASVVAIAAYLLVLGARNTSAATRVPISLLGLLLMAVIPMAAILRSDGWSLGEWLPDVDDPKQVAAGLASSSTDDVVDSASADSAASEATSSASMQAVTDQLSKLFAATGNSSVEDTATSDVPSVGISASSLLAICVCIGAAIGIVRLLLGYVQIRLLRRESEQVAAAEVNEIVRDCAGELGLTLEVSTAISKRMSTPAVIGWRRPTLLLPTTWTDWSKQELRAVVAHELAHVKRRDFLATACAQLAVAINFFHPLAHLVLRRMRLDQELAADTLAASLVGGQKNYVQILACLALRQPRVRTPGPAQAFLPPRRMFVRRLEMLRTIPKQGGRWATLYSLTAAVSLIAVALLATGLRPRPLVAQQPEPTETKAAPANLEPLLNYVPAGFADAIIHIDAKALLQSAAIAEAREKLGIPDELPLAGRTIPLNNIDSLVIAIPRQTVDGSAEPLLTLRTKTAEKWGDEATIRQLDPYTVARHSQPAMLKTMGAFPAEEEWQELLTREKAMGVSIAIKVNAISAMIEKNPALRGELLWSFSPLWKDVETITAGIRIDQDVLVAATLDSDQPQKVANTLTALRIVAQNFLSNYASESQNASPRANPAEQIMASAFIGYGNQLLEQVKIESEGNQVKLQMQMKDAAGPLVAAATPAVIAARVAAQRTQSMNNLKQIILALHNYHSAYNHFPSAVVVDKESGVKRSWRVEILPFIEQQALYAMYQKDKPWDSPENLKVLEAMPPVFASPGMTFDLSKPRTQQASMTGYLAITSEDGGLTLVNGEPPKLSDFLDGTSNTALILETSALVPWTKPADMDDVAEAPSLGSVRKTEPGIPVAFTDGSVQFISNTIDAWVWKALTTRTGAEEAYLPSRQ